MTVLRERKKGTKSETIRENLKQCVPYGLEKFSRNGKIVITKSVRLAHHISKASERERICRLRCIGNTRAGRTGENHEKRNALRGKLHDEII